MLKIQEHIAAKKVQFSVIIYKHFLLHAVKITIFFTPLVQASTTLKGTFLSVSKSGPHSAGIAQQDDTVENPKKRAKIGGAICNAAASCNSKANYKNAEC